MKSLPHRVSGQMKRLSQIRQFSMAKQKRMQAEQYACPSLTSLHHFAQSALFDNFGHLEEQVQKQPPRYGLQLMQCADSLLGSKVKKKSSALSRHEIQEVFDLNSLKRRVYLRCMEDINDPKTLSMADIIELFKVLKEFGPYKPSENELTATNEIYKALYIELLENRAHFLTDRLV